MGEDKSKEVHVSFREESRNNYGVSKTPPETSLNNDQISLGAHLRMADSLEKIANTLGSIESNLSSVRWNIDEIARRPTKEKREITRLKNQIKKMRAEQGGRS